MEFVSDGKLISTQSFSIDLSKVLSEIVYTDENGPSVLLPCEFGVGLKSVVIYADTFERRLSGVAAERLEAILRNTRRALLWAGMHVDIIYRGNTLTIEGAVSEPSWPPELRAQLEEWASENGIRVIGNAEKEAFLMQFGTEGHKRNDRIGEVPSNAWTAAVARLWRLITGWRRG